MIGLLQGNTPAEVNEVRGRMDNLRLSAAMAEDVPATIASVAASYETTAKYGLTRTWCGLIAQSDDPVGTFNALSEFL